MSSIFSKSFSQYQLEIFPMLARISVELENSDGNNFNFLKIEKWLENVGAGDILKEPEQGSREFKENIALAKSIWRALRIADEAEQLDGEQALDWAAGWVFGRNLKYEGDPEDILLRGWYRMTFKKEFCDGFRRSKEELMCELNWKNREFFVLGNEQVIFK